MFLVATTAVRTIVLKRTTQTDIPISKFADNKQFENVFAVAAAAICRKDHIIKSLSMRCCSLTLPHWVVFEDVTVVCQKPLEYKILECLEGSWGPK